jgi:DNA-binding Xre family transcriptional regulator
MSIKKKVTALKVGQELIELGLKVQRKEISLSVVINEIDPDFLGSVSKHIPEWEKDIEPCDRISALMEIQDINKSALARRLGISRQYATDLLNGKKPITLKSAKEIAHALEVPVSGILGI